MKLFRSISAIRLIRNLSRRIRLRTWVALGLIIILTPLAFAAVYGVFGALGGSSATPVAHWSFDEGVDNTCGDGVDDVCDSSGNGNHGEIDVSGTWQSEDKCVSGKCMYFNGTTSRIDNIPFLYNPANSDFTYSGWVKFSSFSTNPAIFQQKNGTGNAQTTIEVGTDGTFDTSINGGDGNYYTFSLNQWYHLGMVHDDSANTMYIYVNGDLVATDTGVAPFSTTDGTFILGTEKGEASQFFHGFMDEVKVYTTALTASQIQADYTGGAAVLGTQDTDFLNQGLVGYWPMEESSTGASQTDRSDSSGNGFTLTDQNTTASGTGKFGNAADFETDNSEVLYSSIMGSTDLQPDNTMTVATWINIESMPAFTTTMVKEGSTGGAQQSYYFGLTSSNLRGFVSTDGTSTDLNHSVAHGISTGSWHHVAWTLDGSNSTLFLDGEVLDSTPFSGTPFTPTGGNDVVYIGTSINNYFDGLIDEVRVYNRALSGAEVRALYNWAPGPVGYWNFDEGSGSNLYDRSGNGNNGTITEAVYKTGKFGGALDFDGSNDRVEVADSDKLDILNNNLTVMAWVKREGGSAFNNPSGLITKSNNGAGSDGFDLKMDANVGNCSYASTNKSGLCMRIVEGVDNYDFGVNTTALEDGAWHHVAAVFDRTADANNLIYIDGVAQTTTNNGTSLSLIGNINNSVPLCIGKDGSAVNCDSDTNSNVNGYIDEVRIYNYARTQQQIVEDMNAGHPTGGSPVGSETIYWNFDEQYGTTANDTIGNQNGTVDSNLTWSTQTNCKVNGCLLWDAAGEEVSIATANDAAVDFNGSEPFSGSAWVNISTMPASGDEDAIIAKWDDTNNLSAYKLVVDGDASTGHFEMHAYDESASQEIVATQSDDSLSASTWYHVAWTFNGGTAGDAGDLKLYIDGVLTASNSQNASFLGIEDLASDFTVGEYDPGDAVSTNTAFAGYIDEVKIYSSELTAEQVKIDYNAGATTNFGTGTDEKSTTYGGPGGNPPIMYINFDENQLNTCSGGSNDVCDRSGNGYDGPISGNPTWVPGKYGSALDFDGTDDYIDFGDIDVPVFTTAYSISWWMRIDSQSFDNNIYCASNSIDFCIYESSGTLSFCGDGGTCANTATSSTSFTTATWYHVVLTYDGTSTYTFYTNGVDTTSDSTSGEQANSTNSMNIGRDPGYANELNGVIDEFKVFDYEMSQAQVAYEYNRGAPIGWWQLDDGGTGNGLTLRDNSGNGYDATSVDGGGTALNCAASGKLNTGCTLDGTNDYISVTDTANLRFDAATQDFSISAWVKRTTTGTEDIVSKEDAADDGWRMLFNSSNQLVCSQDASDATSTRTITDTSWHHVACSVDRDGNMQAYIDGKADGSATALASDAMATTTNIAIGAQSYATITNYLNGTVDDVRVYNYALSAAQIKKVMLGGSSSGSAVNFGPSSGTP